MSPDIPVETHTRAPNTGSAKVFALICAYLVLAVAVGVTRSELQNVSGAGAKVASSGVADAQKP
jgi:hypothetical protein